MRILENKSQIWFKVLDRKGESIDGELTQWKLPDGTKKGDWIESTSATGTLLVVNPKDFLINGNRAFVAEFNEEPIIEKPGLIWIKNLRLVREATNLDLKPFGIYRSLVYRKQ